MKLSKMVEDSTLNVVDDTKIETPPLELGLSDDMREMSGIIAPAPLTAPVEKIETSDEVKAEMDYLKSMGGA